MYSQILITTNHSNANPRTAYANGVSKPRATIKLAQPNQAGIIPVRRIMTAVAEINTAMKIPKSWPDN
jgi:hypothetical protein